MEAKKLYRVGTNKSAKVITITTDHPHQYPSTWFYANPGSKPTVSCPMTNATMKDIRLMILNSIPFSTLSIDIAKVFLIRFMQEMKEKLDSDWSSYGRVFGRKGETITPLAFVTVVNGPPQDAILFDKSKDDNNIQSRYNTKQYSDQCDLNIALYLVTIYRFIKSRHEEQRKSVLKSLETLFSVRGPTASILVSSVKKMVKYINWQLDRDYPKLIAAIDMFIFKFPLTDASVLRFGSQPSRFRDCSSLLSMVHICNTVDIKTDDLADWIYTNQAADEMVRMTEGSNFEESNYKFSYFPYQTDFGFVKNTAYSAVMNPNIYFMVHVAGALLGSPRSLLARHITGKNLHNNTINGIVMAYAFRNSQLVKAFKREPIQETQKGPDGKRWFDYMSPRNFQLTPEMIQFVNKIKAGLTETKEGTIGRYLKGYYCN